MAAFTHSIRTRANAVKYAHQSLGNPKISSILKALKQGFLEGCPNMTIPLVKKYLNASPATSKGHMKRPKKGIRSTTPHSPQVPMVVLVWTQIEERRERGQADRKLKIGLDYFNFGSVANGNLREVSFQPRFSFRIGSNSIPAIKLESRF